MIAVVAGATGLTGRALLQILEHHPEISEIHAWVRTPGRLPGTSKLREHQLPLRGFREASPLRGELYFCAIGTTLKKAGSREAFRRTDHDAVLEFARHAQQVDAACFAFVSSSGTRPGSPFFYSRVKAETEQGLTALGLRSLVIGRPALLLGHRAGEERLLEGLALRSFQRLAPIFPPGLSARVATPVEKLAAHLLEESLIQAKSTKPRGSLRILEASSLT
jgi:uncharacterized protein YbjT (DUF2867 family)